jgi:hypothetical protein
MILRIVDLILFKFMYASNYSKNLITAEEKVAELMKQRDAALIRAEKAEHELADHITALKISNRSADEQMRYKREAESKVEQLNLELTALGNLAVGHWDDSTVGRVDALIPHETQVTYKEQLKTLFSASSKLAAAKAECEVLEKTLKETTRGAGLLAESHYATITRLRAQESDYVKMIAEVLKCEPRSACEQSDNRLEAPWGVIARLRTENERLKALGSWAHTCIHHTDTERKAGVACPVCVTAELTHLRAEVEQLTAQLRIEKSAAIHSLAWAEKAEAELRIAQNWVDHHSQHADDLIGKNVKLREALEQYRNCVIVGGTNPAKVVLDDLE